MKKKLLIPVLLLAAGAAVVGWDVHRKVFRPYQGYSGAVEIRIARGQSITSVAALLREKGIVANALYFRLYCRLHGDQTIKAGDYRFSDPMTVPQILAVLHEGKVLMRKITVPEGLSILEIADLVQEQLGIQRPDFVAASRRVDLIRDLDDSADDLEGYLFPATYQMRKDCTADELVEEMVKAFRQAFGNSLMWRSNEMGFSVRQTLTLASLIEKETASREERFLISSVFHNRLKRKMLLDCDPTVVYALKKDRQYFSRLGWAELKYESPYNTRLHPGLPPGPICNPGLASIEAALYPETTNYYYFVARDPQSHHFSESLQEHNRAVYKYIIRKPSLGPTFPGR